MFGFGKNKDNNPTKDMTEKEKREYERKHKNKDEWDELIEADALGFFDE
ncbi:MAG TPA: hypothetical protein VJZ01_10255 [Lachnospiraceae bacterium]|jgi:hypothetical protein|nr:hypothetical protein [Lachnospiraceae bacterium]